ncbi:MAG TPA: TGS domain-containing protein, partial [Bacteroidales bacterium]|nr:TGS domain-containing protein [Bacteroidales bacterium]
MVKLTFPDGTVKEFTEGITGLEIARQISPQLAKEVLSVSVNGELYDLTRPITTDANIKLHKWEDEEGRHAFWHSSAHLMAEAIEQLWPGTKFGIGPAIENGFYYDIDPGDHEITDDDLISIENRMKELASQNQQIIRKEVSKKEALEFFEKKG